MSETREFPTAAILSVATGVMFVDSFSKVHEAAEFLMGHPIWTHHFADETLRQEMRATLRAQHPDVPHEAPGVTAENWRQHLEAFEAKLGKTLRITKGPGLTAMLPTDGLPEHLRGNAVIIGVDK